MRSSSKISSGYGLIQEVHCILDILIKLTLFSLTNYTYNSPNNTEKLNMAYIFIGDLDKDIKLELPTRNADWLNCCLQNNKIKPPLNNYKPFTGK